MYLERYTHTQTHMQRPCFVVRRWSAALFSAASASPLTFVCRGSGSSSSNDSRDTASKASNNTAERDTAQPSETAPPPRPIKRGKTLFFEEPETREGSAERNKSSSSATPSMEQEKANTASSDASAGGPPKPNSAFLKKLASLQRDGAHHAPAVRASESRKEKIKRSIERERKTLLVFRDVGMTLDKAILSRDVLLIPKYFYYGVEYAIDNELERMLRFFNEHAINEMKLINDGKLMRGPERLAPARTGGFPLPALEGITKLKALVGRSNGGGSPQPLGDGGAGADPLSGMQQITAYGSDIWRTTTTLSSFGIRKPTMIILTQLGQKLGGQADWMWRHAALEFADPKLAAALRAAKHLPSQTGGTEAPPIKKSVFGSSSLSSAAAAASTSEESLKRAEEAVSSFQPSKPLDVLSLRSLDVQSYKWVHRLYVRRFLSSILTDSFKVSGIGGAAEAAPVSDSAVTRAAYSEWLLGTTLVGPKLLTPFFNHGLRNYLSPTVMLVDHRGQVRWIAGGLPDARERAALPKLFQQLCMEYYKDNATSGAAASSNPSSPAGRTK